jgi:hypothetical protein
MNDEQLEQLGAEARRAQDAALATRPLPPLILQRPSPRPVRMPLVVVGAVSAAVVLWLRPVAPGSTPVVEAVAAAPTVPSWIKPEPGARVTATSAAWVSLDAGSVLLLGSADASGPAPVLDVGAWRIEAQPGARALVRWDPAQLALAVEVSDGDVRVRGAGVVGERVLRAGEQLALSPREAPPVTSTVVSVASVPRAAPNVAPVAPVAPVEVVEPLEPAPIAVTMTWQELARAHHYTDALSAARREGIGTIQSGADAEDLQLLGDSARFSLDVDLSTSTFTAMRRRFAGTLQGARANFYLARIASDARRDDAQAALLLRVYLDAAPDDVLSQEASGRLVEVLARSGRRAEARDAADVYLRRWPAGPHAELCRSMSAAR